MVDRKYKTENHSVSKSEHSIQGLKLASFKEDQQLDRCNAASHVGPAVFAHVNRSGRLDAALR